MSAPRSDSGFDYAPRHDPAAAERGAEPRRIAIVISSLAGGGAERVASTLAKYWVRAGYDLTVITLAARDADVYELAPGVRRVALDMFGPSRSVVEAAVQASRRVAALRLSLAEAHPDVVVSFMTTTNVLALLAVAGTGIPVLACERSDPRHDPIAPTWAVLRRMLYPIAAGVVVQTESVAGWARRFSRRVHVIPNMIERSPRVAAPGKETVPRRLVAMGRLGPEKGFDLLIAAFARVAPARPDWSLTILGEGPERRRLEALVESSGLGRRVVLPGRVPDPIPHLAAADAFALASRYEGFPNALLEAMACGLPVVAFDCPSGPADVIVDGRNGLLVRAGDVVGFAGALARLMASPDERVRMGARAREVTSALSPDRVLERWSAALRGARAA